MNKDISQDKQGKFGSAIMMLSTYYLLKENMGIEKLIARINAQTDEETLAELKRTGIHEKWKQRLKGMGIEAEWAMKGTRIHMKNNGKPESDRVSKSDQDEIIGYEQEEKILSGIKKQLNADAIVTFAFYRSKDGTIVAEYFDGEFTEKYFYYAIEDAIKELLKLCDSGY